MTMGGYGGSIIKRALGLVAAAAIAGAIAASEASAESQTAFNTTPITFLGQNESTAGSPNPSLISVTGQEGPITDVDVNLNGIDMASIGEFSGALLVSPSGETEVLFRGGCDGTAAADVFWTFDQQAASPRAGSCPDGTYLPSDACAGGDGGCYFSFPGAPGPPYTSNLNNFNGENANGTWRLYVYRFCNDGSCPASGDQLGAGWSIGIDTGSFNLDVPAGGATSGPGNPYPSAQAVSGKAGLITDVNVTLNGVFHTYPGDLELMLEGPGGQRVMLMSDACGSYDVSAYGWTWNDEAPGRMPIGSDTNVCGASEYRPTDLNPGDSLPAPAPTAPYATSLSAFDLTDPKRQWRLWVADESSGDEGFYTNHYTLDIQTRPRAATAFAAGTTEAAEGATKTLTVTRSGANAYAAATVDVATSPGTAGAADFTPVSRTLQFAPGQTVKTVDVQVAADGEQEAAEAFTLSLSSPTGDAVLGSPSQSTVTIPADPAPTQSGADSGTGAGGSGGADGSDDADGSDAATDRTAPQTEITRAPKRATTKRKARIEFRSSEPGSSFECKLDRGKFGPCASPAKLKMLHARKHRFRVRAVDPAGNVDPTPAATRWKVIGSRATGTPNKGEG
jgi:subtilisin-like proprotein convertase family protein